MTITRKQFLRSIAGAGVGIAGGVALAACGDDSSATPDAPAARNCVMNGTTVTFSADHGHTLAVSAADITAGVEKMYTITGGGHTHTVTITAALFTMLQANMAVMAASSNDGHSHQVTITCA